jgi:hypothetical protein
MAESVERRSNRSRKPKVPFEEQHAQSLVPLEPSGAPKATKSIKKPLPSTNPTTGSAANTPSLDAIEELCS